MTDDQILEAYQLVAQTEGVFCEPASAASLAGFLMRAEATGVSAPARRSCAS